jgi:3'-phosphoadenosine 5'-phosphosulfate (PAPS) 3'-phosphatase
MTPLIASIYEELSLSSSSNSSSDDLKTVKRDNSAFTIADGTVQRLLIKSLFAYVKFRDIVGEEEVDDEKEEEVGKVGDWYQVQGLTIPHHIQPLVDSTRMEIESLAEFLVSNSSDAYLSLSVFVDPIDGTREFESCKGEQCSICIGFSDEHGRAVAGVVYRPLSQPSPTWVAGAKSEGYAAYYFGEGERQLTSSGFFTTNGSISKFLESLIEELNMPRIKSGGAGNKMMMLLQRSILKDETIVANREEAPEIHQGHLYIQVSSSMLLMLMLESFKFHSRRFLLGPRCVKMGYMCSRSLFGGVWRNINEVDCIFTR